MMFKRKRKVGIAFGGGGARGLAHIGVIKALRENGIEFDFVSGTSAGSVAASLYSVGMPYDDIYNAVSGLSESDFLTSRVFLIPSNPAKVQDTVSRMLGDYDNFDKCKIPLAVLSVDISTGKEHVFRSGAISFAVSASCAVPGMFMPVKHDDLLLMDGGLTNNIPAMLLRDLGCDAVVSVEVNADAPPRKINNIVDVLTASLSILVRSNSAKGTMVSDVVIKPSTHRFKFSKVESVDELIEEGYKATIKSLPEILRLFG